MSPHNHHNDKDLNSLASQTEAPAPDGPGRLDTILIIDKPAGWTSHDVVAKMRRILKTRRIGHTGTLDPFATGVLVVCVNQATRLVQFLTGHDKEYLATLRLGWRTETGDLTGRPIGEAVDPRRLTREEITAAMARFRGPQTQIPPMYSAKKLAGRRLYELARAGQEVERPPVSIDILALDLLEIVTPAEPLAALDLRIRVTCSAGTYIRTLAEDIGAALGVGAHLVELRRIRAGECRLDEAVTLDQLAELVATGRLAEICQPLLAPLQFPVVTIEDEEAAAISHGRTIYRHESLKTEGWVSLVDRRGRLQAIAESDRGGTSFAPRIVFNY